MKVNAVVTTEKPKIREIDFHVTQADIEEHKKKFLARNLSLSPEEFAGLFGKQARWALERMHDGSVVVLDEYAKNGPDGIKFSRHARVSAESVEKYQQTLIVAR